MRSEAASDKAARWRIDAWTFDPARNRLTRESGEARQLEHRASKVLARLAEGRGDVVSKDELLKAVWDGRTLSDNSVAVVISDLRKALGDDARDPIYIQTVPKRGYRLQAEAVETGPTPQRAAFAGFGPARNAIIAGVCAAIFVAFFIWRGPAADATQAPNLVITVNDVQNRTGDPSYDALAALISEFGAAYLATASEDAALVRDRWDFDAEDPSRGLYEYFGADAQVYHVTTRIVLDEGAPVVTMFANDPQTNEVMWATAFPAPKSDLAAALQSALDDFMTKALRRPAQS